MKPLPTAVPKVPWAIVGLSPSPDRLRACRLLGALILCLTLTPSLRSQPVDTLADSTDARLAGQVRSPNFCPGNPYLITFERRQNDRHQIYLYDTRSGDITPVSAAGRDPSAEAEADPLARFFDEPEDAPERFSLYETHVAWRPVPDRQGRHWLAFVSSAGGTGYDLYFTYVDRDGRLASDPPRPLQHTGNDDFPRWSPDGRHLVFVSEGESGGDLYLLRDIEAFLQSGEATPQRLTPSPLDDTAPSWSPDGRFIAYEAQQDDDGLVNLGINLLDVQAALQGGSGPGTGPVSHPIRLTGGEHLRRHHEYQPTWSPNGQFIAYYVSQTRIDEASALKNSYLDIGIHSVVYTNEFSPRLADLERSAPLTGTSAVLAENVVPDHAGRGPLWIPQSNGTLQLVYVVRDAERENPILVGNLNEWQRKVLRYEQPLQFQTLLNRDVDVAVVSDALAFTFISQVENANRIQVRGLPAFRPKSGSAMPLPLRLTVPGLGPLTQDAPIKGAALAAAAVGTLGFLLFSSTSYHGANSDLEDQKAVYRRDVEALRAGELVDGQPLLSYRNAAGEVRTPSFEHLEDLHRTAVSKRQTQRLAGGLVAGVFALNMLDALVLGNRTSAHQVGSFRLTPPRLRAGYRAGGPSLSLVTRLTF